MKRKLFVDGETESRGVFYLVQRLVGSLPDYVDMEVSSALKKQISDILVDNTDGMIVWIGVDPTADDYLGLGLEDGLVKVVWNLGWFSRTELVIPDLNVTDSSWHRISLSRY